MDKDNIQSSDKKNDINKMNTMNMLRRVFPIVGLVLVFILFNVLTHGGMIRNLSLILSSLYSLLIASIGVFFIMAMGGLDFSQGSILGISSLVICFISTWQVIPEEMRVPLAIIGGIFAGACIGAINGFFYVNRKIKSFIVTICTMFLFRGVIKYFTSNAPVPGSAMMQVKYDTDEFKIGCTVIILLIAFIAFTFTKFGIHLKSIGAGEKAAKFVGIKTDKMKFLVYVLAGAITGFAAFISVIKVGSVTASGGSQLETQILIALVLGGMPISGGAKVKFENIIIGACLYTVLNSGLNMIGVSTQALQLIEGIIFLIFVAIFADRKSLQVIK